MWLLNCSSCKCLTPIHLLHPSDFASMRHKRARLSYLGPLAKTVFFDYNWEDHSRKYTLIWFDNTFLYKVYWSVGTLNLYRQSVQASRKATSLNKHWFDAETPLTRTKWSFHLWCLPNFRLGMSEGKLSSVPTVTPSVWFWSNWMHAGNWKVPFVLSRL